MSVLARFRDIMASNVNVLLDKAKDPEKEMDEYMRSLNLNLGAVKAETASVEAEESRAKRAWEECKAEISKLQRYAEKSVEAGDEEKARSFLEMKAKEAECEQQLQAKYHAAAANAARMKHMQDKLIADMTQLESRRTILQAKLAAAKAQQKVNEGGSPLGSDSSIFDAMEEKANRAYDEAMALAELRQQTDIDALFENRERVPNADKDLAAIKEKLQRNE
ncbi:PspA/IM30 family protein [Paenibacillus sp. HB172176]|uniref:PspA/IM30 family protein n=1 Tax=Paenibacillus sp. HB172176 TaxID=2493690 RepID=UPI00143A1060|nr:PspA/IM30 family protein [Paenibacillus sp. HB172176]